MLFQNAIVPAAFVGFLVMFTVLFAGIGYMERALEFYGMLRSKVFDIPVHVSKRNQTFKEYLSQQAKLIDELGSEDAWIRIMFITMAVFAALGLLFRQPLLFLGMPLGPLGIRIYAGEIGKAYRRKVESQTRLMKTTMAFLMRAGASTYDTLSILANEMDAPLGDKIRQVIERKRYSSLPEAMIDIADKIGVSQLSDLAVLISESEKNGTPLSEAVLRTLKLDMKLRDVRANQHFGESHLKLGMYATLFIAFPGFGFLIYALMAYTFNLFSGTFL